MNATSGIDHDRLFKELISTFFVEFLELFFPEVIAYLDSNSLIFLDKEVFTDVTSGEKHEADLVVKAKFRGKDSFFLINVEPYADNRGEVGRKMFQYFARLFEKHQLPVYPIALFSYSEPLRLEPDVYRVEFPDRTVLEFKYQVVQLNRLYWRDFLERSNPVASALMSKMRIRPEERPKVKAECLRLLATLKLNPAKMQLISGFVDTYLRLNQEEQRVFEEKITEFQPQQKEGVMEIVTSWMEQGIERGEKREALSLILRQLTRRVGVISPELESQIQELSLTELETLAEDLLDFNSVEDLQQWLVRER